jgi:hypothetical protein
MSVIYVEKIAPHSFKGCVYNIDIYGFKWFPKLSLPVPQTGMFPARFFHLHLPILRRTMLDNLSSYWNAGNILKMFFSEFRL